MKLTPTQARDKIRLELNKGNGIYIHGRWFDVRVHEGKLQVSDFHHWHDVEPGAGFRNAHGRDLFTYEPDYGYKRLIVVSANEATFDMFAPGAQIEVTRETAQFYIISPGLGEIKVSKKTLLVGGNSIARGVQFKAPMPPIKPFEFGHWAAWQGTAGILLSDESVKKLREFETPDDCINWLFQFGCKDAARALNAHVKGAA